MTELNHNEQQFAGQKTESADPNDIQSITIHDIISMMLSKWHWFAISVVLFIAAAAFYIMRTSPVYHREATIMVKDSRKGSGSSEMAVFSELSGFSTRRNVDNELFVLQARRLMMDVVERLNLTIGYTMKSGLRTVDLYKHSPIEVNFINDSEGNRCTFRVKLLEDKVEISHFQRPKQKGIDEKADKKFTASAPYGEVIDLPNCQVTISKTLYMDTDYIGKTIYVSKSSKEIVASRFRQATKSSVANKMSSIINISLNDVVAQRAEDVINTLIDVYNDDAVADKQQVTEATADFIDSRLVIISKELGSVDSDIKTFKKNNNMVDIKTDTERNITESAQYKAEGLSIDSQIEMARFIREYLNDASKETSLIPITALGDNNVSLSQQISEYNELVLRREKLLQNGAENNPVIRQLDRDRVAMKNAILASLESHISTLEIKLANLRREESLTNMKIGSVPAQEQEYLSIARQQRIKEELYLYLLNKREENAISLAITENTARIIDAAFGPILPIAPRKTFIMLIALILGLAIPFAIIYLKEALDTTIHSRREVERYTRVPFLGDIPVYEGKTHRGVAVRENGRDKVSEAFRIIRTNMNFMNTSGSKMQVIMITSSNAHAGKTFVSTNLGMTLAFSGAKVLLIDLDLRRRTMTKHMGQRNNPNGVSKYISDTTTQLESIIAKSDMHENIDFIYAGLQPPNPAEMLLSDRLDEIISACRKKYDYIIIDSVPAMVIADAMIASRVADISIYVVREGLLDRRQLPDIDALYRENKLKNMCIILNSSTERDHTYGYSYSYTDEDNDPTLWHKILDKTGINKFLRRNNSRRSIY